jgi:hypothetical protein
MAAGSTYTPIATTTFGSAATSYTFTSIPSTYTDLVLVVQVTQTGGGNTLYFVLNGDTGTNYSTTTLNANGTNASSSRASNQALGFLGGWNTGMSNTVPATVIAQFNNYSNSTTYKTCLSKYGLSSAELNTSVSLWRSTAAVTSIQVKIDASSINTGTTMTLYGIAAA